MAPSQRRNARPFFSYLVAPGLTRQLAWSCPHPNLLPLGEAIRSASIQRWTFSAVSFPNSLWLRAYQQRCESFSSYPAFLIPPQPGVGFSDLLGRALISTEAMYAKVPLRRE